MSNDFSSAIPFPFSAVILAGGGSRRMGQDKAWMQLEGRPLLSRQVDLLRSLGPQEVFVSGRPGVDYSAFGCPVVQDRLPGCGPLGGIEASLAAASTPLLLVLAVDMPGMHAGCLRSLGARATAAAGVVPRMNGRLEPLAAIYPRTALQAARALLEAGAFAVSGLAGRCLQEGLAGVWDVGEAEFGCFANWNEPSDWSPGGKAAPRERARLPEP